MTQQLEAALASRDVEKISNLISKFSKTEQFVYLDAKFKEMKPNPSMLVAIATELVAISHVEGFRLPRFFDLVAVLTEVMDITEGNSLENVAKRYQSLKKRYYTPFLNKHGYILENYLVNRLFQLSFPFSPRLRPFELYTQIVVKFTIIKMLIIGVAAKEDGISSERGIEIIQLVTKVMDHSPKCLESIELYFRENHLVNMGHMATLLVG